MRPAVKSQNRHRPKPATCFYDPVRWIRRRSPPRANDWLASSSSFGRCSISKVFLKRGPESSCRSLFVEILVAKMSRL